MQTNSLLAVERVVVLVGRDLLCVPNRSDDASNGEGHAALYAGIEVGEPGHIQSTRKATEEQGQREQVAVLVHGSVLFQLGFDHRSELGHFLGEILVQHPASALKLQRALPQERDGFGEKLLGVHELGSLQIRCASLHKRLKRNITLGEVAHGEHEFGRHAVICHLTDATGRDAKMVCERFGSAALRIKPSL